MSDPRGTGTILTESAPDLATSTPPLDADRRGMPTWVAVILCCSLIQLGFVFWAQARFSSYGYALRYLRGDRLQVSPAVKSLGTHRPGEVLETTVTLRNHGSTPVHVVGATSECACTATRALPAVIRPHGGSLVLPLTINLRRKPGEWEQSILYRTDDTREPVLRVDLTGWIADR